MFVHQYSISTRDRQHRGWMVTRVVHTTPTQCGMPHQDGHTKQNKEYGRYSDVCNVRVRVNVYKERNTIKSTDACVHLSLSLAECMVCVSLSRVRGESSLAPLNGLQEQDV